MPTGKDREAVTGHAIFSPSQLPRILRCTASLQMSLQAPIPEPSIYAQRGTKLHELVPLTWEKGENWLRGSIIKYDINLDDVNQVLDCVDYLRIILKQYPGIIEFKFENPVSLETWGLPEVWGTADILGRDDSNLDYHIVDWKFGSGIHVAAEENEQMLAYAAGAIGYPSQCRNVHMHIGQPPFNYFQAWVIPYKELQVWVQANLASAIADAKGGGTFVPGEKQCKFCPAGMTCPARHKRQILTAKEVFKVHSQLATIPRKELSDLLIRAEELDKYIKDIRTFAHQELLHSREFPMFKLVAGRSTRQWVNTDSAIAWLKGNAAIKETDLYTRKPVSPAQAEKLDRVLKKDSSFKELIHKPTGAPKLVEETDKREAYVPTPSAVAAFSEVAEGEE